MHVRRVAPPLVLGCLGLTWLVSCAGHRHPEPAGETLGNARRAHCADTAVLEIAGRPAYRACSVDSPVYLRPDSPRAGVSPALRSGFRGGRVLARFVVDETGRVEPGTAEILASSDTSLTRAVWTVLPALRFTPAERDGRPVRQQVSVPFEFSP